MKKFSKINRGLILTVAVLLGLSIYLVLNGVARNRDKKELMDIAQKYINTEVSYNMLPEKYRSGEETIPAEELDSYIKKMKEDIKVYYVDNEANYKYLLEDLEESLRNQAINKGLVHSYSKTDLNFKSISFNGNKASVKIETSTKIDREADESPYSFLMGSDGEQTSDTTDTIMFQKVDGEWKVTFSNLSNGIEDNGYDSAIDEILNMLAGGF